MSTPATNQLKTTASAGASSSAPERGETMSGAEILVACLEREGVDSIFAYPGGASMHMHQALTK
jgi:acetolactate synthase-1/2/3 large subunit